MKTVADGDIAVVETFDGQVLAECAGREIATERGRPPVERQRALEQDRLILAAVVFRIADRIADEAEAVDHDGGIDGRLVDAGLEALARQPFRTPEADGEKFHKRPFRDSVF